MGFLACILFKLKIDREVKKEGERETYSYVNMQKFQGEKDNCDLINLGPYYPTELVLKLISLDIG